MSTLSRRKFIQSTAAAAALASLDRHVLAAAGAKNTELWYRRALRWGQTNITEIDPPRYDIAWWRAHWKRTRVQGVVINAGGIVAYYPTKVPHHRRASGLGDRDLFGELVAAAHEDGLCVFARMDSNRADEAFFRAQPDWFARDASGQPYIVTGLYVACVNSPYYDEHIPAILGEVAGVYHPEGVTDNNWNGPMRHQPCYCTRCEALFHARTGHGIPRTVDWDSTVYRDWIMWNYERRLDIWDMFNRATRAAGGPDCLWVGMMAGSNAWQARVFRDDREIYRRTPLIMLDDQRRFDSEGFQHNGEIGRRLRSVGGWDKVIPESMAMYHLTEHNFRLATKPVPEVRMWAVEGFAGGVQPWWHHVGAVQEDRRMFETAAPLWQWHEAHTEYLVNRRPVVSVGLLWSQRNMDFFGRDDAGALVDDPWNGWGQALIRARIPYLPVHLDDIEREATGLKVLVLPNLGAMSDAQVAAVRGFVERGGSLIATGATSLCNEWGEARSELALGDLLGARLTGDHPWRDAGKRAESSRNWSQTYLRLPRGDESVRHETIRGFAGTDILAFGGTLDPITVTDDAQVPLTFIPPVAVSPPESVYMQEPVTAIPGLVLRTTAEGGRIAYLPADIDRRFARDYLPDHGDLLARITRWTLHEELPLRVEGPGLIDCHLYRQSERLVLHLINLTSAGTWRTPVHELIAVGPHTVRVRLPDDVAGAKVRSLVSGAELISDRADGWCAFTTEPITDHEVIVIA